MEHPRRLTEDDREALRDDLTKIAYGEADLLDTAGMAASGHPLIGPMALIGQALSVMRSLRMEDVDTTKAHADIAVVSKQMQEEFQVLVDKWVDLAVDSMLVSEGCTCPYCSARDLSAQAPFN